MTKGRQDLLFHRFGAFFRPELGPMHGLMCFGFEVGDGWFPILYGLFLRIEAALPRRTRRDRFWYAVHSWFWARARPRRLARSGVIRAAWDTALLSIMLALPPGRAPFEVVQVKEKFGGLRVYVNAATEQIFDLIDAAEGESIRTCEECGKPGFPRRGGWIATLCDAHARGREAEADDEAPRG